MPTISIDSYHGQERRKQPRVPLCLAVAAECDAWMGMCHTKDLSQSGLFLISQRIPSISTGFTLKLNLPAHMGSLALRATVLRIQGDHPRGFGLRCVKLSDQQSSALTKLSEAWKKAFPG